MPELVQNKPVKSVVSEPLAIKKKAPPKCDKGEYLDVDENGKYICLLDPVPFGGLMGSSHSCRPGEECGFSVGGFGIPNDRLDTPPLPDQFKPEPPGRELEKLINGKAQYGCWAGVPRTDHWTTTREISIPKILNEPEEKTRARLEQAARDMEKTIAGCQNAKFLQIISPLQEPLTVSDPNASPSKNLWNEFDRICGPGGKWENRLICWWP